MKEKRSDLSADEKEESRPTEPCAKDAEFLMRRNPEQDTKLPPLSIQ